MSLRSFSTLGRRLWRTPQLSIATVLCIAVGTAATSAGLVLITATLLRPLPFEQADRLLRVWQTRPEHDDRMELSYLDLEDLRRLAALDAVEGVTRARLLFDSQSGGQRVEGEAVTRGYFDLLGLEAERGTLFSDDDHLPGAGRVMVLDHRAWGEFFDFDQNVIGREIRSDDGVYVVKGVLPPAFTGTVEEDSGDIRFWVPVETYLPSRTLESREARAAWVLARRAADASLETARSQVAILSQQLETLRTSAHQELTLTVEPLGENWRSTLRPAGLLVMAAALLLLVVATTNVAVLLIARSLGSWRETAVRTALGARRRRLIGSALAEILVLTGTGSALGWLVGPPLLRLLLGQQQLADGFLFGIPVFVDLTPDWRTFALSMVIFLGVALGAGLGPSLLSTRIDPARALAGGRAVMARQPRRTFGVLVVIEVLVASVLIMGTGMLARSYEQLRQADLGFRSQDTLRIGLFPTELDVPDPGAIGDYFGGVRDAIRSEPGVVNAALVWPTVPIDWPPSMTLRPPGTSDAGSRWRVDFLATDTHFFDCLGVSIVAGRAFLDSDRLVTEPVVIVSQELARRIAEATGSDTAPATIIGHDMLLEPEGRGPSSVRIVGVAADARFGGPRQGASALQVYAPLAQQPRSYASLVVATAGDPGAFQPHLSRRILEVAPEMALDWSGPVEVWIEELYFLDTRFFLSLIGLFSLCGLVLSATGLFAVLARSVEARRAEMGIRAVLGATPRQLLIKVAGEGLLLVGLGLVTAALSFPFCGRFLRSLAYGIEPVDVPSIAAATLLIAGVCVIASVIPARRAARISPSESLRESD